MSSRQVASTVILLFCGMAFYVIPLQIEDGETGFYSGASLIPNLAVSLIFVFTTLDLLLSFIQPGMSGVRSDEQLRAGDVLVGRNQVIGVISVAALLAVYAYCLLPAGYILSSILLLSGLMFLAGGRRPLLIACVAITLSFILYAGLRFGFGINISAFPDINP